MILSQSQAAFAAARAGLRVLSKKELDGAPELLVAADVNAVPPSGIEGVEVNSDGDVVSRYGAMGIGALTIGDIKYKTESGLFQKMNEAEKPVVFDFREAFALARDLARNA